MTIRKRLARSNLVMLIVPVVTAGIARIRDGDLDSHITYGAQDEFKKACDIHSRLHGGASGGRCQR